MKRKNILAISGSTRSHSTNESILKIIAELFRESLDVQFFSIAELPHFNPDLDKEEVPLSVKSFRELINHADGILICTPEYVFSLPGALKNAIEWTVSTTVFSDKPAALIVASSMGEKAMESLNLIMKTLGAKIDGNTLLISGARAKVNKQGEMETGALAEIKALMNSFERSLTTIDNTLPVK